MPQPPAVHLLQEMLKVKIGVSEPNGPDPETRYVTLWGAPLNVKVAIDVVLLTTGQLQVRSGPAARVSVRLTFWVRLQCLSGWETGWRVRRSCLCVR